MRASIRARLCGALLGIFVGVGASSFAPDAGAETTTDLLRQRVTTELLRPFEHMSTERWAAVGPPGAVRSVLVELTREPSLDAQIHAKALEALAFFPGKRTSQVLWQAVYARGAPPQQRQAALRALGTVEGMTAKRELMTFLQDPEPAARAGAVLGLAAIDDPSVRPLLEYQLEREEDLDVRLLIDQALRSVREREERIEQRKAREEALDPAIPEGDPLEGLR